MHYSSLSAELVGLCVDDTPAEFFEKIDGIYGDLGLGGLQSETIMRLEQHIGLGYARSTTEELQYITEVSKVTGVVLDPVYSGKAARGMAQDIVEKAADGKKRKVLFIHTGVSRTQ